MRAAVVLCLALTACGGFDFSRMRHQRRAADFGATPALPFGQTFQNPPDSTVPRERQLGSSALVLGVTHGAVATAIPVTVTPALLDTGRMDYADACTPCHGVGGYAGTLVAENMYGGRPASLRSAAARAWPAGRIYRQITFGGARMPPFASRFAARERWAIVAYVQALAAGRVPATPEAREDSARAAAMAAESRR